MSPNEIKENISEQNEEALFADGFEDALIGPAQQFTKVVAAYDYEKCIKILMDRDDMSRDDAEEFFSFNVTGAYVGEHTPIFVSDCR
jgi:hypothetical protein